MPGLLQKMVGGAAQGIGQGIVEENKQKGIALREAKLANLKHGYRMAEIGQSDSMARTRAADTRTFTSGENDKTREANATQLIGSTFAGADGGLYQSTRGGKTQAVSVDDKAIRAPKKTFTEKDRADMLLREAGRIRKADEFGDKDEDTIMREASAHVEQALNRPSGGGATQGGTMEASSKDKPLAMPESLSRANMKSANWYQTEKGTLFYFEGKFYEGDPRNGGSPLEGASEEQLSTTGKEQTDFGPNNQAAPVKSALTQEAPKKPREKKTMAKFKAKIRAKRQKILDGINVKLEAARADVARREDDVKNRNGRGRPATHQDKQSRSKVKKLEKEAVEAKRMVDKT